MLKKIFFQIHWFLGITAGLILSIIGVTGALYSYDSQILKWLNQESYVVQVQEGEKLTPEQLYLHFSQQNPDMKINSISVSADPEASSIVNIVKEGERRGYNMMVNPYTADVLPEVKGREFFSAVQSIHRWLTVGEIGNREIGKQIVGASTLMLIFFVLSGLYLRWPRKHSLRQWFAVKRELSGRNFLWDLHAVVGTWVAIFYLILAVTGLYWSYDWWRKGLFTVMGVPQPVPQQQVKPTGKGEKKVAADQMQVQHALHQAWENARTQLGRGYSTITFNVPKHADGKIELSYVDVIPQHERARNSVVYDYQQGRILEHKIYEDKKLNEKIMSSMLPVHRGSFFGSTYQFLVMLASLAMPVFFVTGWLLYLKRRRQKQQTKQAKLAATQMQVASTMSQADWLIVYATQSGTAEQLAWQTASSLQQAGLQVDVKAIQEVDEYVLAEHQQALFIASTFGTGEAPDLAVNFVNEVMEQELDLSHLKFAVLALGSKEYDDTFCLFGHQLASWLKYATNATPLFDTIEVDNVSAADLQRWNEALANVTQLQLGDIELNKAFHRWTLAHRQVLNPETQGNLAYHIELENSESLTWSAGDIAEIKPANSLQRIHEFLQQQQIDATYVLANGQSVVEALHRKNLVGAFMSGGSVDDFVTALSDLPTREYSIANIPQDSAVQRLHLVVRQQKDAQGELGLGSGWLTQHMPEQSEMEVFIRSNSSFHLIEDDRPIICIGNGTGIAGLMSLLQARIKKQYHENWLIFGERERKHDFFYQSILEQWQMAGQLKQLNVAFSRDQAEKVYVQDVIRQHATQIQHWVNQGAVIYVCGSIDGMASGVDHALIDVLGTAKVDELRVQNRYRRDVY